MQSPSISKTISLNLNFGMKAFESLMQSNFISIQDTLIFQQKQITRINAIIQRFLSKQDIDNKKSNKQKAEELDKQVKNDNLSSIVLNTNSKNLTQELAKNVDSSKKQQGEKQVVEIDNILEEKDSKMRNESKMQLFENQAYELQLQVGAGQNKADLLGQKVFQLFQKVRELQEKQTNMERYSLKKFRQFQFQINQSIMLAQKSIKSQSQVDQTIDKLRNQLTQYKLKKQSKILKALNSSSIGQTSTSQNYDYIAEKMQYILKHMNQLTPKRNFEQERDFLHQSIENLRKKMNQTINQTYLTDTLKGMESRIYQSIAKYIKAIQFQPHNQDTIKQKDNQLQSIISEGNKQLINKNNEHQRKIQIINEDLINMRSEFDLYKRQKIQFESSCFDQIRQQQQRIDILNIQDEQIKKFLQQLNKKIDSKQIQTENQIIQLQETVDKISSTLKTYNNSLRDTLSTTKTNLNLESQIQEKGIEVENDLKSQQKKINKLQIKLQSLKEDILNYRNDLMRQIDGLKANLQKKADWESLKKGLNFVEQKIKETKAVTQAIYQMSGKQDGDSLAVKKGWTCLVCDKDIKSYEGKLGQLKFTSMFPVRQSPRIGGYYKQQQTNQEYKQVFLSNSNNLNRSRRIGSLKSNQSSKEELQ